MNVSKLVVLKLDGDLDQHGFRVVLEMGYDGDRPLIELAGALPPDPELLGLLQQWQQAYRSLGIANRIRPQEIVYGGSVNRLEQCRRLAHTLGHRLNTWLDAPSFQPLDRRLREFLNVQEPIRMLLRTQNEALQRLPWHLWHLLERYTQVEVALCAASLERPTAIRPEPTGQVRILAILGHCQGIEVEAEQRLLKQLPHAEVTFLVEPPRWQVTQQLWDQPWDILFFAGHSQTKAQQGWIQLNPQESLTLDDLKYGLRRAIAQGLQLAIFNSCDGLGLAQALKQLHLPQMIVMREPIPDLVAQVFLQYFLEAFVQGEPLYGAVRQARERLQGLEGEFPCASWLPIIYQCSLERPLDWDEWVERSAHPSPKLSGRSMAAQSVSVTSPTVWQRLRLVLMTSCLVAAAIAGWRWTGGLQPLDRWAFDQLLRLRPSEGLDQRILIVKATEQDFQRLNEAPLSDRTVAKLLQKLKQHRPRIIGLDLYRDIPQGAGRPDLLRQLQQPIGQPPLATRVIAACKVPDADDAGIAPPPGVPPVHLGFTDVVVDANQVIRRHLLSMSPKLSAPCATGYGLSFLLAAHYLEAAGFASSVTPTQDWQFGDRVLPRLRSVPGYGAAELSGSQIWLNYRAPVAVAQQVTVTEVLNDPNPDYIRDRIILIGVDADNNDRYFTPYSLSREASQSVPGVVIHAQMVSQLVSAVMDRRPLLWMWPAWGEGLWLLGWSVVGGLVGGWVRSRFQIVLAGAMTVGMMTGISFGLLLQGGWVPLVPAALAALITGASLHLYQTVQPISQPGLKRSHWRSL